MSRVVNERACTAEQLRMAPGDPVQAEFNMGLARPLSRAVRLNGFATCLRLEEVYWKILERIAAANRCTVNAVLSHVDREVHLRHGGVKNFSGLVRVICVVYVLRGGAKP